jgi:hypothetical protein
MRKYVEDEETLRRVDKLGVLTRQLPVRLLNCSPSGCLVETSAQLEVGTVGSLRLAINSEEFMDDLMVVRCQAIMGAGSIFHVGAKFLWTDAPGSKTLRRAMERSRVASTDVAGAVVKVSASR